MYQWFLPVLILLLGSFQAQSSQEFLWAEIATLKVKGTELRLRGDFAGANRVSRQLKETYPDLGIGYAFNLNTLVTQLSWDEQQTRFDKDILQDAEKTLSICRKQIDSDQGDYRAHYLCGQAHFALTYLHALRGNYYRAGTNGSKTISSLERALKINPELTDAKMHLGVSYYYADNLPSYIKVFSKLLWFIPTGNSDKSLPYVREVAKKGKYFKDVAKYLYASILIEGDDEERLATGTTLLQELVSSYPENSRFQLRYISQLGATGRHEQSLNAADTFITTDEQYKRDPVDIDLARLWVTRDLLNLKQVKKAIVTFNEITRQVSFPAWGRAWYLLTHAQISDLQKQRNMAKNLYNRVIKLHEKYPSSTILSLARAGLNQPFTLTEPPL